MILGMAIVNDTEHTPASLRVLREMEKGQLAAEAGVDIRTVSRVEAGKQVLPTNLRAIAEVLKVTPEFLFAASERVRLSRKPKKGAA